MPSTSPSPVKRPSITERTPSGYSDLSSSGKPATTTKQQQPAAPRAHYVTRHSRNFSHGKGLNKAGKVNSMANVYGEGRNHQRKRSGPVTPSGSPRESNSGQVKRNSSHVVLPKNTSHGNLRKNQSAGTLAALNRNLSHGALRKLGAPPSQKAKDEQKNKQGVFDLGGHSSGEEEEGEWEDSTTQSPELTRHNSKTTSPTRVRTPDGEPIPKLSDPQPLVPEKTSSPPEPSLKTNNRSAPDLRRHAAMAAQQSQAPPDPALLYQNGRAGRAPPAISAANALGNAGRLVRNESTRSLQATQEKPSPQIESVGTSGVGQSSSGSVTVSHFLPVEAQSIKSKIRDESDVDEDEDEDDASAFMSNYRPQVSESPEKSRILLNKARGPNTPSRTQQKLELQRREAMRGNGTTPPSASGSGMPIGAGSSISLHNRTGSRGRVRTAAGDVRAVKQDYDTAVKLLTVVRRFRNPVLESLQRLKDTEVLLSSDIGTGNAANQKQSRPQSRHGRRANGSTKTANTTATASPEDKKSSALPSRSSSRARGSRVQFQLSRQGSHDDMLTASHGSPEAQDYDGDGLTPEQALIRRMWDSRVEVA